MRNHITHIECFQCLFFSIGLLFCFYPQADSPAVKTALLTTETTASEPAKVTITKVFDFAGEEVRYASESSSHFETV